MVCSGSRPCENAKAINRDRTTYSFKIVSRAHIARAFNFEIERKNIVLVALRTFEFSHRLGHERRFRAVRRVSAYPLTAAVRCLFGAVAVITGVVRNPYRSGERAALGYRHDGI